MMFAMTESGAGMALPLILIVSLVVLLVLTLAFEVWMFVDAVQNPRLTDTQRVLWCAGMLLVHPFVAVAYYFITRQGLER
jgi:hypothetical protein